MKARHSPDVNLFKPSQKFSSVSNSICLTEVSQKNPRKQTSCYICLALHTYVSLPTLAATLSAAFALCAVCANCQSDMSIWGWHVGQREASWGRQCKDCKPVWKTEVSKHHSQSNFGFFFLLSFKRLCSLPSNLLKCESGSFLGV